MSYLLILVLMSHPNSQVGMVTSQQLGPYESLKECEAIKSRAVTQLENDTSLTIKGSCVEEEPTSKEVKLYEDD